LSRADRRRGAAAAQLRTPGAQLRPAHLRVQRIIPHAGGWGRRRRVRRSLRPCARWNRHGLRRIDGKGSMLKIDSAAFQVSAIKPPRTVAALSSVSITRAMGMPKPRSASRRCAAM
jgi:hypothetical protein